MKYPNVSFGFSYIKRKIRLHRNCTTVSGIAKAVELLIYTMSNKQTKNLPHAVNTKRMHWIMQGWCETTSNIVNTKLVIY